MKIACLLDEGFEDSEFKDPYDKLKAAGHEVLVVGFKAGPKVTGYHKEVAAAVELDLDHARPQGFDGLFIPGGYSPDHLRGDQRAIDFVRHFMTADKPVLAICHGPQLLLSAGVVDGRRMTAWKTVQVDLRYAGAHVTDAEVVVDGNLVTSRQPGDIPAFVAKGLELLAA
jgi:protease I